MNSSSYKVEIQMEKGFTRFKCSGSMNKHAFLDLHERMRTHFKTSPQQQKALVDLALVESVLSDIDRYELALSNTSLLMHVKQASLVSGKKYVRNLFENAANNRGGEILLTTSEEDAIKWLLG